MAVAAATALSTLGGISAGAAGPDATAATLAARAGPIPALQPAALGAQLWVKRFRGAAAFNRVAASPDGSKVFVLAGISNDYATFAYDAATGVQLWRKRYNGPADGEDDAWWMAVSPDGSTVFATGTSHGSGTGFDYATVAYNAATGATLWARRYTGPGNGDDYSESVAASPDGTTVFVTGDSGTVAYNAATGAREWVAHYPGALTVFSMAASPDGTQVFITGWTEVSGTVNWDYVTIAYAAATGAQQWAQTYNGPADRDDVAYSVAVSPSGGTVYVTGLSEGGPTGLDYATVAYAAATGAQQWLQRYNGLGNGDDYGYSVATGPDGKVFVTGNSQYGLSTTIAYSG